MTEYHKIQSIYKRDMESKKKLLIEGDWTLPEFEYLANNRRVFTEKVDGTNIRIIIKDGTVEFGGRTNNASIPASLIKRLNERFKSRELELNEKFPSGAVLYGEGYGAKIQKGGGNYREDQDFVLFDVIVSGWWLQRPGLEDIAKSLDIEIVPIIGTGTLHNAVEMAKKGIVSMWGDFQAEGIVARPETELRTRSGHRIIAKIKCRDFE